MSHFMLVAILPKDAQIEPELAALMAPYDEELAVDPYEDECYCVRDVNRAARAQVLATVFGDMHTHRRMHEALIDALSLRIDGMTDPEIEAKSKKSQELWDARIALRDRLEQELLAPFPEHRAAEPECSECKGSGKRQSTYNPKSKWDWYRIGGRFNGIVSGAPRSDDSGFNFNAEFESKTENVIPMEEYANLLQSAPDVLALAYLTPEGEWIERGQMGWWAMVSDGKDPDAWHEEAKKIAERYREGHIAVGVDVHI